MNNVGLHVEAIEETDVTDAEPTELLSLLLTCDFWTLRTDETNTYEPVLGHSDTEESGSDGRTLS